MQETEKDFYKILELKKNASPKQVERAYKRAARKYYPDVNPNDDIAASRFREISEAYEVLSDPEKRKLYDKFGYKSLKTLDRFNNGNETSKGSVSIEVPGLDIFDTRWTSGNEQPVLRDIFPGMFEQGKETSAPREPKRGADIQYPMEIGFEDSIKGLSARINVQKKHVCSRCKGVGYDPDISWIECNLCNGKGKTPVQKDPLKLFQSCTRCNGKGKIPTEPCNDCGGKGYKKKIEVINARIPPGVYTGARIRLNGKGEPGINGGPPGDLYILTRVRPHPFFERIGHNLTYEIPITFPEAVLGAKIKVPTLEGQTYLTIPVGTRDGNILRLRGKGLPLLHGEGRGDILLKVKIHVPCKLNKRLKDLLREYARLSDEDPRKGLKLKNVKVLS